VVRAAIINDQRTTGLSVDAFAGLFPEMSPLRRAAAAGNATVPTVNAGSRWLVNPSLREILDARNTQKTETPS